MILVAALPGQYRQCLTAASYQPAAVSYVQPTYAAAYVAPAAYVEKTVFIAVEDQTDYYGGLVGSAHRSEQRKAAAEAQQAQVHAKIDALTAEVRRLQQVQQTPPLPSKSPPLPGKSAPDPDAPPSGYPEPSEAAPPPPPIPSPPVPPRQVGATIPNPPEPVLTTLRNNCARCHSGLARSGKGFKIFEDDKKTLAAIAPAGLVKIDQAVWSGKMPQDGQKFTDKEYSDLRAWLGAAYDETFVAAN